MKKHFFIVVLLLNSALHFLTAQNFPFPTADAEWINISKSPCMSGSLTYGVWREYLYGDTVLDQITYHKVYRQSICRLTTQGLHCSYQLQTFQNPGKNIGAIREENQQVFFRGYANGYEGQNYLLYDFNWVVGDTFASGSAYYTYRISNITTTADGRKRFELASLYGNHPYIYVVIGRQSICGNAHWQRCQGSAVPLGCS